MKKFKDFLVFHYHNLMADSMHRNSIYLMLSTYLQAAFGFLFWLIASHFYSSNDVGLATALISALSLLSTLSLIGMDNSLVRYLSISINYKKFINFAFSIVIIGSLIVGMVYIFGIHFFSPKLIFISSSPIRILFSIFIILSASLYTVSDYVFIALKQSGYVLGKSVILSLTKVALPLLFLSQGAYGLFLATGLAMFLSFIFSIFILKKKYKYYFHFSLDKKILKLTTKFASSNYIAGLFESLPSSILPIIIVNKFPPRNAAYFYIAFMIANLLYRIPVAVTQSFFAASVNNIGDQNDIIRHTIKTLGIFLLPAIAILIFGGRLILLFFGKSYADSGSILLIYFSVAAIPISMGYVLETILRIHHKNKQLLSSSFIRGFAIILISFLFLKNGGLAGIGAGWLIGQCVAAGWLIIVTRKNFFTGL